jgi:hypothetical protein
MNRLELVAPVDDRSTDPVPLAPRLDQLAGARIGLLDNRKGNANVLLEQVGAQLEPRGASVGARVEKRIFSRPASDAELEQLRAGADAVVTAVGD